MDNSLFESLENQTAPESTRGLFDPPSADKKVVKKNHVSPTVDPKNFI